MFYGAPVTTPMEVPQEMPSRFRPELEMTELPSMKDATAGTIRLEGTLARRMPSMPGGKLEDLYYSDSRRIDAEEMMAGMRNAYGISHQYDRRNAAVAKARARQNDRQIKNSASQGRIQRRKLQGQTKRMEHSAILRNARDYLGIGTDMFR
jgi:hypothetical protein